jgi:hypothetical protein
MRPARASGSTRRRVNALLVALTAIATPAAAFQTAGLPLRVRRPSPSARGTPVAQAHLWQPPTGRRRPATLASAEQNRLPRSRAWARWVPRVLAAIAVTPSALFAAGVPVRAVLPPNTWTIPLVAGVLNMVTNKLAVKMMFYPLRFRGIGRVGWHGIVPSKALPMANDIVDNVMLRLINVSQVFTRLPPEELAASLDSTVLRVGRQIATEIGTDAQGRAQAWAPLLDAAVRDARFNETLLAHSRPLFAAVVRDLHREAESVFDLRSLVVQGMTKDSRTLVRLFERCGERDLRFVVRSGLLFGGLLGLLQMLLWRVWSPWWSLALTGGLVGYVTDLLAIRMLFEPVNPLRLGPLRLHGLFLQRQPQVSDDFAAFMQREVRPLNTRPNPNPNPNPPTPTPTLHAHPHPHPHPHAHPHPHPHPPPGALRADAMGRAHARGEARPLLAAREHASRALPRAARDISLRRRSAARAGGHGRGQQAAAGRAARREVAGGAAAGRTVALPAD